MKLEQHLVLTDWLQSRLGAQSIEELKRDFHKLEPGVDGETPYLRALLERDDLQIPPDRLREYDARIRTYETRLAEARGSFAWKYFQYLALLHVEILLDSLTDDPAGLVRSLNAHLREMRRRRPHLDDFPDFLVADLRRLALFMATGSGKTLLMHANLWQVFYYLRHGRHSEALVMRTDGREEFDNILLITPNEGLSEQHLEELRRSGIDAVHLAYDEPTGWLFGPQVRVIEIHKLAEEVSGDGLSIPLESLGSQNLVLVDEGHKGVGSDAQKWKNRQQALSSDGFMLEYSATFAQAVGGASRTAERRLLVEYGKAIAFDYSYRHFYADGYGKHFQVLNLESDQSDRAHELLVGGLLAFYQQIHLFQIRRTEIHPYRIERPLWVFLGAGVVKTGKKDLADVANVVAFLRRFLEDSEWAKEWIGRVLGGTSGFKDDQGQDVFHGMLGALAGSDPETLYDEIRDKVFHGRGALEVWELKRSDSELGLRTSGSDAEGPRYFGVVNVGDPGALRRYLERRADFDVKADEFTDSLFPQIDADDSPVNVLVGSKKFIEGWSSWRVSCMGLLNMGRGEGPQVIQLFGRGVRLKGKDWTLQRSTGRPESGEDLPKGLRHLETLYIFGWNADYVRAFRKMLSTEEVGWEMEVPVRTLVDEKHTLWVPEPAGQDSGLKESWILDGEPGIHVKLDLSPRITAMSGNQVRQGAGDTRLLDFSEENVIGLVDVEALYLDLLEHKDRRRYGNVMIRPSAVRSLLRRCDVHVLESEATDPERVQEGAYRAAAKYLDRFAALKEREAQSRSMRPVQLKIQEKATRPYRVRGTDPELRESLLELIEDRDRLYQDSDEILPRLHVEQHLFTPLLLDPKPETAQLSISPAGLNRGEAKFIADLVGWWYGHHTEGELQQTEIYLLRNLPHSGVGFFRKSGFYPDFILWVERGDGTLIQFVEPHGMHHGGLDGNADKIAALHELERLSEEEEFKEKGLSLSGYIITETSRDEIPGAEEMGWDEIKRRYRVLPQSTQDYLAALIGRMN